MTGGVSRRELLAGIGMAGAAIGSSAVGHSTASAFLSDAEDFAGNVTTSGELDISISYTSYHNEMSEPVTGTADGEAGSGFDIPSLKPTDYGRVVLCPEVVGNPGYLWLCGDVKRSDEAGKPDPEGGKKEPGEGPYPIDQNGEGELEDAMKAELAYINRAGNERTVLLRGTFDQVLGALQYGLPLSANPSYDERVSDGTTSLCEGIDGSDISDAEEYVEQVYDPIAPGGSDSPGEQACFDGSNGPCVELRWCVPESINNEISTDEFEFEFTFHAQQCRHNDGKLNPCAVEKGISFVAFCAEGDTAPDVEAPTIVDRNGSGEPVEISWTSADTVDTIVLKYGQILENFHVGGANSGAVRVGDGKVRLPIEKDGGSGSPATMTGQSESDPCPEGETGVKYESSEFVSEGQ